MNLDFLWIVVGLAVVVAALETPRCRNRAGLSRPWPLEPGATLLSEPEQVLYGRLIEALPDCQICPQVQLLQAVRFKRGNRNQSVFNRISQLSIDFLIGRPDTSIVAAVEFDDASHRRAERRDADARKTHAPEAAGIPLIRWEVGRMDPAPRRLQRYRTFAA